MPGKWFWREIGSYFVVVGNFYYDRKKKIQLSVWRVRDHYYDRKKKRYSRLSGGYAIIITTGKKNSRLSGRLCCCVSFWFWREIGSFFVVVGKFYYDRKKSSSRLSDGLCYVTNLY